ncbi:MAG TPA: sortase [Patescibacteria group bacterium]|nr:sortase [Patescibacteria group bacterium]
MTHYVYSKSKKHIIRRIVRLVGLVFVVAGMLLGFYIFYPLLSWQLYLQPVFASNQFTSPIPKTTIMNQATMTGLFENAFHNGDWLPSVYNTSQISASVTNYSITIPKLQIENAKVVTTDTDISKHLIHFPGTAIPPQQGNAVVFGHSTLPQFYEENNYKTIFAKIHNMTHGDTILVSVDGKTYRYIVSNITIVDSDDTSYLEQDQTKHMFTIVTCTPPGTTWKRLLVQARLSQQ